MSGNRARSRRTGAPRPASPGAAPAPLRGIACVMGAMAVFSFGDMLIKWLSGAYPLHEIVLLRGLVALPATLLIVRREGGLAVLRTTRPWLHVARGGLLFATNMGFFLALAAMPLAEASALFFVAPLFITMLSVPVLGERVGPRRWAGVIVGLAGTLIVLRPGGELFDPTGLLPLFAAGTYAVMQMITRRLGVTDVASAMSFYVHVVYVTASATVGLAVGDGRYAGGGNASLEFLLRAWVVPAPADLALIAACGLVVTVGGYLLAHAYRISEAAVVAPFEYTSLPLMVFWGFVVFGDLPDAVSAFGIALIAGSGLYVYYRETRAPAAGPDRPDRLLD